MDFKNLPVVTFAKNSITPVGRFYFTHQQQFWFGGQLFLSIATPLVTIHNSREILDTIADAKKFLSEAKSTDEQVDIYIATLKKITPLVAPIVLMVGGQIYLSIQQKKAIENKDKKIAELNDSLAMANNAIVSYQAFKREAESRMTEKKLEEVKEAVAKETITQNPQTEKNTVKQDVIAEANENYKYYDVYGQRYFYSSMAPSDLKMAINDLSIRLSKGEINNYDSYGRNHVTINDVYRLIDSRLVMHPAGDVYGWFEDDRCGRAGKADERLINYDIRGIEDPAESDKLVWQLDLEGAPLFHSRF